MSDVLRNSDDTVVRFLATHNEGYMIDDLLDAAEANIVYWTSWRGYLKMTIPMLMFDFCAIIMLMFLKGLQ